MKYLNNQHLKSDFVYRLSTHVIAIKDLNLGKMSVTNNIEAIVEHICHKENINPNNYTIVYMDSFGEIDEYRWSDHSFHHIPFAIKEKAKKLLP